MEKKQTVPEYLKSLIEAQLDKPAEPHPLPMVLAGQFCDKDQKALCDLARLATDIEPKPRNDVAFMFSTISTNKLDEELKSTILYVQRRFPVLYHAIPVDRDRGHPDGCWDLWSGTVSWLAERFFAGEYPYADVFLFEADGCPLTPNWINRLKEDHTNTVRLGKRVTGPIMRHPFPHVNGTLIMDLHLWENCKSLHTCPPGSFWDIRHGRTLLREAGPSHIITNPYGTEELSESAWLIAGTEAAWMCSIKDGRHHHWARKYLVRP